MEIYKNHKNSIIFGEKNYISSVIFINKLISKCSRLLFAVSLIKHCLKNILTDGHFIFRKCINSVEGRHGIFFKIFQNLKSFVVQWTIELRISSPSNLFGKKFMAPPFRQSSWFHTHNICITWLKRT